MHTYPDVRRLSAPRSGSGAPGRHAAPSRHAGRPRPGPSGHHRAPQRDRRHAPAGRPAWCGNRVLGVGSLAGVALSLVLFQYQFRHLEAEIAASVYRIFTPVLAASSAPVLWFGLGTNNAYGLEITPDCSSALLVVPLCVLGMLLMIPRRLAVSRTLKAIAVAAVVLVSGNLLRIGVIAVAVRVGGLGTGYQIGHLILGSVVSIVCIAVSLALLTAIVVSPDGLRLRSRLRSWHRRTSS